MRTAAVIFDMDGTLTVPQHDFDAIRAALDIPPDALILEHIDALPSAVAAAKRVELEAIELEIAGRSEPAPGVHELLTDLRERALPIAVLTRNSRTNALASLAAIDAYDYFDPDLIVGRDEATPKPHPAGIELLTARMGIPPKACLMVGDYRHDLQAGRRAGCTTVHVRHPGRPAWPEFTDRIIAEVADLAALIPGSE